MAETQATGVGVHYLNSLRESRGWGGGDHRSVDGGLFFHVVELVALEAISNGSVDELERVLTDCEASRITGDSKIGEWRFA